MNESVFRRLVWKEYRMQRAFWIAMAVLTVLVQLLVLALVRPGVDRVNWLFALGLGFPAFYALGCGATLFATEHETGTYEFQRILPVSALRLFFGKAAFAVASTLLLVGLLWSSTAILAGWRLPRAEEHLVLWGLWGMAAVELLVWGMFFSLLCPRPLLGATLAVTAASVSVHVAAGGPGPHLGGEPYLAAVPFRVIIAGLVTLADIWLGCRWFRERIAAPRGIAIDKMAVAHCGGKPLRRTVLGRLLWHQWRQSTGTMAVLGALLVPLVLAGVWVWDAPSPLHIDRLNVTTLLASVMASLWGSCVFLGDQQQRRFRFFAEQGLRPRYVWLSRQLIWIWPVLLIVAPLLPLHWFFAKCDVWGLRQHPWQLDLAGVEILITCISQISILAACFALAYGSGQLCSMFLRSGILAAVFGLLLTAILCGWAWLMVALEVSLLWSVWPIPLVLLLVTWLRAPDWILERNTLRAWLRPGLALMVPVSALLAVVPLYRVYQIPDLSPGFSPEAYARPATAEQRATVEMYQRAYDLYVPWRYEVPAETEEARRKKENAWLEANQPALALTIKASERKDCDFFDSTLDTYERKTGRAHDLGNLLFRSARQLQLEGKLDAALKRYLAALRVSIHLRRGTLWPGDADALESSVYDDLPGWAANAQQTPQRIRGAILELDKLNKDLPPRSDAIKSQYLLMRRIISADPEALAYIEMGPSRIFRTTLWSRVLPWEKSRALRVLNVRTARELTVWNLEDPVSRGARFRYPHYYLSAPWLRGPTYPFYLAEWGISRLVMDHGIDALAEGLTLIETRRRAVRLLLALQAWKIEHGELPETLDELVGPNLEQLPLDPYSGEPFRFFRQGLPIRLVSSSWHFYRPPDMEAGTTFIWSTGPSVYVQNAELDDEEYHRYFITGPRSYYQERRRPTSEYDVWVSGWWFPLP